MSKFFLSPQSYRVRVDCSKSIAALIAAGRFCHVSQQISDGGFPITGKGTYETDLRVGMLARGCSAATTDVLDWIRAAHLRPARLEELLALAEILPDGGLVRRAHALAAAIHDQGGLTIVVSLCLHRCARQLRCSPICWEPAWASAFDCFPCVAAPPGP